jgi:PST family polysaccharide transporter
VENSVFLIMALARIIMIQLKVPLITFAWAVFIEVFLVAVGFMLIYTWRGGRLAAWQVRLSRAKNLLKDSWPLALSGFAISVYMRIDQIMLGQILDDRAVGIYSAAVRISEVWYFIPMAIAASVFPAIIEAKKKSEEFYCQRLQKLYDLMVLVAVSIALPMTFLSGWIVTLLFGQAYAASGIVLAIHIWAGVFVFLGVASGKWFLVENLQKLAFYRTFWGMVINILLNVLLIPKYGVVGAAIATVISYSIAALWFDAFNKDTRAMFIMKIRSLTFKGIIYEG